MSEAVGELCQACGLCCDGTLFARARLVWSEAERLPLLGLPIVAQEDGSLFLSQPCQALDGARCRIYADRPRTCREYACDLADALAGNELDLSEALAIAAKARGLARDVAVHLPPPAPGTSATLRSRVTEAHQPLIGEPLPDDLLQKARALEEMLDHSFRGRRGRGR